MLAKGTDAAGGLGTLAAEETAQAEGRSAPLAALTEPARALPVGRRPAALHKVRSDLAVIVGYSALLAAQIEGGKRLSRTRLVDRLHRIHRAAADLTTCLVDLEESG